MVTPGSNLLLCLFKKLQKEKKSVGFKRTRNVNSCNKFNSHCNGSFGSLLQLTNWEVGDKIIGKWQKEQQRPSSHLQPHRHWRDLRAVLPRYHILWKSTCLFKSFVFHGSPPWGSHFLDGTYPAARGQDKSCPCQHTHHPAAQKLLQVGKRCHLNILRLETSWCRFFNRVVVSHKTKDNTAVAVFWGQIHFHSKGHELAWECMLRTRRLSQLLKEMNSSIHLTKHGQDLNAESHKMLMKTSKNT